MQTWLALESPCRTKFSYSTKFNPSHFLQSAGNKAMYYQAWRVSSLQFCLTFRRLMLILLNQSYLTANSKHDSHFSFQRAVDAEQINHLKHSSGCWGVSLLLSSFTRDLEMPLFLPSAFQAIKWLLNLYSFDQPFLLAPYELQQSPCQPIFLQLILSSLIILPSSLFKIFLILTCL